MVRPIEATLRGPSATIGNRSDCKVISAPTGVAGGDNVDRREARAAPGCHAPSRPHAAAPGLRRRLPVGRHHGQEARAGDDHHHPGDHDDDGGGAAAPAAEAQDQAGVAAPAGAAAEAADSALHPAHGQARPAAGRLTPDRDRRRRLPHGPPGPGGEDRQRRRRPAPGRYQRGRRRLRGAGRGRVHPVRGGVPLDPGRPGGADPLGPLDRHRPAGPALPPAVLVLRRQPRLQEAGPGVVDDRRRRRELPRQVLPGQQRWRGPPLERPQPVLQHLGAPRAGRRPTPRRRRRCSPTGAAGRGRRSPRPGRCRG